MTDAKPEHDDSQEPAEDAAPQTEAADAAPTDTEQTPDPGAVIQALAAENAELKDKALRAVAEAENVRRRADKERGDTVKYGAGPLAKELLPVIDNLRRAIESVPEDKRDDESVKGLVVGVEMTEKMLLDAFGKHQIVKLDPVDEKFNHAEHQAIQEVPGTGKPGGTVVQVLQPGYKLHDRLLRPAMVLVAKADAAAAPPDDAEGIDTTA